MTLVECLVALVIVAIAILGVTSATTSGHQHQQYSETALRAIRIAEQLIEEIQSRPYSGSGADRQSFHMNDYNNLQESPGQLRDFTNALCGADDQTFSRSTSVTDTTLTVVALESAVIAGKTVVVTVRDAADAQWQLSRFIPEPVLP